jgi:hypothetical protein
MNYVRVENGVVVDLLQSDEPVVWGDDAYAALWTEAAGQTDVQIGWVVQGQGYAAPPPIEMADVKPPLSFLQFMDLFTEDEQLAIAGAAMTDAPTKLWYDRAVGAQFIDLSDERLIAGMQALVDGKMLTATRRNRILKGLPPAE